MNEAVTFRPSELVKRVMVPIMQDNVFEGEELFTARLTLDSNSNGVRIGRQDTATTAIVDGRHFAQCHVFSEEREEEVKCIK